MRDAEWKIVRKYPGDWELYNRAEGEAHRVRRMIADYKQWAANSRVLDWPIAR